ncbi:MAG: succinylglutamate desuccinylase/aspartoacylase family protein [Planctomycetaceae bacterium]
MSTTPIRTGIDYDKQGKQWGTLSVPYSYNLSGWSKVQIPIAQISNGSGPTVLLMAGNHGDEYPGQVAIMRNAGIAGGTSSGADHHDSNPECSASRASTRLSPVDGKNLNRCFPGNPVGTITEVIAHYLTTELFPISDIVIDLHTGGRGIYFYPCAHMHLVDDLEQRRRMGGGDGV